MQKLMNPDLAAQDLMEHDVASRLAIRCLWTLQNEVPVEGGIQRKDLLRLLHQAMAWLD